jgi:hypothetical protein
MHRPRAKRLRDPGCPERLPSNHIVIRGNANVRDMSVEKDVHTPVIVQRVEDLDQGSSVLGGVIALRRRDDDSIGNRNYRLAGKYGVVSAKVWTLSIRGRPASGIPLKKDGSATRRDDVVVWFGKKGCAVCRVAARSATDCRGQYESHQNGGSSPYGIGPLVLHCSSYALKVPRITRDHVLSTCFASSTTRTYSPPCAQHGHRL